jgi:plastocyanin
LIAVALALIVTRPASAVTHQATIGNYYYEDDQQRDQTKIVVHQGDQITFLVREQAVPGHTVDVDALNIHSPNLNIGDTFTTPPLNTPGNFYLYCRPHEARGHHTRLIVLAAPAKTAPPPQHTATPPHIARAAPTTPAPAVKPTPAATLTPVGVGTAPPGALSQPVPTNPNSLRALTGRTAAAGVPWTRSLWWLLIAVVPITAAAGVALQRARVAQYQPRVENLRRARAAGQRGPKKPATKRAKGTGHTA